jgi:hypothetical protein
MWGSGGIALLFLTSALDGDEVSASRPDRFTPEEKSSDTHCVRGWVGLRFGLDAVEERKNFPLPEIEPRTSSPLPVAIPTDLLCISIKDLFNDYEIMKTVHITIICITCCNLNGQ